MYSLSCVLVSELFFFSSRRRHTRSSTVSLGSEMCIRDRGSQEALAHALAKLSTGEVKVNIIHGAVGGITESLSLIHI